LFRDLLKYGYPCLSLHGGKDQSDRECTVSDFKSEVGSILIATSVAARGLDVKDLVLVLNYDVPNHHEDYVHRWVGEGERTPDITVARVFFLNMVALLRQGWAHWPRRQQGYGHHIHR